MADIVSKAKRSEMMSGIRGKDTKPELLIRRGLHARGYRYQLHGRDLPGRPDIVLPKYRTAIFVNGCFWHGHNCRLFKWPKTRAEFWRQKIYGNILRDENNLRRLIESQWRPYIVWECSVKGAPALVADALADIEAFLTSHDVSGESDSRDAIQSLLQQASNLASPGPLGDAL